MPKTYLAEVSGVPGRAALRRLREGIDLDEAFDRMMAKVETRDRDRWTRKEGNGA